MFSFEKKAFWESHTSPPAYLCLCCADMVSVRVLGEMLPNESIPENSRDTSCSSKQHFQEKSVQWQVRGVLKCQ